MIETKQKKAAQRLAVIVAAVFLALAFPVDLYGGEFNELDDDLPWDETSLEALYIKGTLNHVQGRKAFHQVNVARAVAGVKPLELDTKLQRVAMRRAAEISLRYSHDRPDGTICNTASNKLNGENIAKGKANSFNGNAVVQDWTSSPEDLENMLNGKYQSTGISCFSHNGTNYWVQVFSLNSASDKPDPKKNQTVSVKVHVKIDSMEIAFAEDGSIPWRKGKNGELPITVAYESAKPQPLKVDPKSFHWKSSKNSVVSVTSKGKLTGRKNGTASIKATLPVSGKQVTKKVVVVTPPKKVYIKSAWKHNGFLRVKWKKVKSVDGYEVLIARDKKFTKERHKIEVSGKRRSASFQDLQKDKNYYVKVRAIRKVKGKKVNGFYSKAEKAKL